MEGPYFGGLKTVLEMSRCYVLPLLPYAVGGEGSEFACGRCPFDVDMIPQAMNDVCGIS